MPLKRGSSRSTVSDNVREMMDAGHTQRQSVAASMRSARDSKRGKGRMHKRGKRRGR